MISIMFLTLLGRGGVNQSKKFKALEKNILVQYFVGTQHKDWTQKSIENMTKIQWKI